jgi:hypothetical protein
MEAKRDRGTHKWVSKNMYCYGGLMATRSIFLTADGTVANEVTRRIGRRRKLQAPICIKRYNKGMQQWTGMTNGGSISLASRHGSKVLRQNYSWVGGWHL